MFEEYKNNKHVHGFPLSEYKL